MGLALIGMIKRRGHQDFVQFSYEIAYGFWRRFLGLKVPIAADALLFPKCVCVHGFGLSKKIQLVFLGDTGEVLRVSNDFGACAVSAHFRAAQVLEFLKPQQLAPGDYVFFRHENSSRGPQGFSALEMLIALPVLFFVLFVTIQIGLLWHAKFALQHAVVVAARHASVSHGSDHSIRDGLVQGLMPLIARSKSISGLPASLFRTGAEVTEGLAMGWLRWEVLSPTRQSFQDWGRPTDPHVGIGAAAGEVEIPSAPLPALALRALPASGVKQYLGGLPVGIASGHTLIEANNLKLRLQFGVPLNMPIAGPLLAGSLSLWSGCGWPTGGQQHRIGPVNYGFDVRASVLSSSIECRSLAARDLQGRWKPRWPIQVFANIAMQSSARRSQMTLKDRAEISEPVQN